MKFSIVTSFFNNNEGKYIEKIYDSVLSQTYENWEWIITDDFSNDGTLEKIKKFEDDRIKLVKQKTKKELFINPHTYCTGDVVVQLDSDDEIYPKALEVYHHFFSKNPDVFFMSVGTNYYEDEIFTNSQVIEHGHFDNCFQKKIKKDDNWKNPYNFLHINGAWGNLHAWRNVKEINFNLNNYQNIIYPDQIRALTLEEYGKYLHLPRTLYQNNIRSKGLSHRERTNDETIDYVLYMHHVKERRKQHIISYDKRFNSIFEESYMMLYSDLSFSKSKKNVSIFNVKEDSKDLLRQLYFDHNLFFDIKSEAIDYYFLFIKEENDLQIIDQIDSNNLTIYTPFYLKRKIDLSKYFDKKKFYNDFFGSQILVV